MEAVWFTLVAIGIYLASDRALDGIERARGSRFGPERTLVFFAIFIVLALPTFWLLRATGQGG